MDNEDPNTLKSKIDNADPNRANPLNENAEPTATSHKILNVFPKLPAEKTE